jgi:AcrR family transcriptional regulator
MGRPAKFTRDQILDSAARLVATEGPTAASVTAIASELGAPSGSIYHRFESRELMMAELWIRTVRRAQPGFVLALAQSDLGVAAHDAVLHIPRWSRSNLTDATVAVMYRREDLAARWPAELGAELATLNQPLEDAIDRFARRLSEAGGTPTTAEVVFALIDMPAAAVRRYLLRGRPPPKSIDHLVIRVCDCLLFAGSPTPG